MSLAVHRPPGLPTRAPRLALVLLTLLGAPIPTARAEEMPSRLQAAVHLRLLAYEHSLRGKRDSPLAIAVLYDPASARSRSHAEAMTASFTSLGERERLTVHGRPVRARAVAAGPDLRQQLASTSTAVLYVAHGMSHLADAIGELARELKLPSLCGDLDLVRRGIAVGVVPRGGTPHIVISARAVQHSGMVLDPRLLRLAEVVR